jgi:glycerol-3-phosphate dehydrogenase
MEVAARVLYARDRKWTLTVEDVLRRRTTLALTGHAVRARVEALLAS